MGGVRRSNHHQIDLRQADGLERIGDHACMRQVGVNFVGVARSHHAEFQPRHRVDQRRVKRLADKAVANQRHLQRLSVIVHQCSPLAVVGDDTKFNQ